MQKYVHEFQSESKDESGCGVGMSGLPRIGPIAGHKVLPQHVEEYKHKIAKYYSKIHQGDEFKTLLNGSFEITVGDVDTFGKLSSHDTTQLHKKLTSRSWTSSHLGIPGPARFRDYQEGSQAVICKSTVF